MFFMELCTCRQEIQESREFSGICAFCQQQPKTRQNKLQQYESLAGLVATLATGHKATIVQALQHFLTTENGEALLNTLILLEKLIEKGIVSCQIVDLSLRTGLELKRLDANRNIAVKSSKILATLDFIKNYKLPVL